MGGALRTPNTYHPPLPKLSLSLSYPSDFFNQKNKQKFASIYIRGFILNLHHDYHGMVKGVGHGGGVMGWRGGGEIEIVGEVVIGGSSRRYQWKKNKIKGGSRVVWVTIW